MGAQLRAVRRRIRTVQSTAKITRAQELIASSRVLKAQQRVRDATPYARELIRALEAVVSRSSSVDHPLVNEVAEPSRAAVLIMTSDRGFAGGFNAGVLREAESLRRALEDRGLTVVPYVTGRKGINWHRFRDRELGGEWAGFSEVPAQRNAAEITESLLEAFLKPTDEGGVDELYIVHTQFVSMLTQRPEIRRMLPLEIEDTGESPDGPIPVYEFEPSPGDVLDALLPWYVESRIFHSLLDSAAANANELIDQLTREANKARQAEITQEISEIVGGANALAETIAGS
jgi:F-type H+-transporting ATPase subunit gamma